MCEPLSAANGANHPAIPAIEVGDLTPSEPCLVEQALRPWELLCMPTSRHYGYRMSYLKTPSMILYREDYWGSLRLRGLGPNNMLAIAVPLRPAPDSLYWKSAIALSGFPCMLPGVLDVAFAPGQMHFILLLELCLLRRCLPEATYDNLIHLASLRFLPAAAAATSRFRDWLGRVFSEVRSRPEMLQHYPVIECLESDVIDHLVTTIALDSVKPNPADRLTRRTIGLRHALEYLNAHAYEGLTIDQLSQEIGISQRTLERAFRDTFDISARQYMRMRRFHAVRRALLTARKGNVSVAHIAHSHGFYELGRFAVDYRNLFGERPSETLAASRSP